MNRESEQTNFVLPFPSISNILLRALEMETLHDSFVNLMIFCVFSANRHPINLFTQIPGKKSADEWPVWYPCPNSLQNGSLL